MFDFSVAETSAPDDRHRAVAGPHWRNATFLIAKRGMDIGLSLALLPVLLVLMLALWLANPFYNHGPLFFVQKRMGRGCVPFMAIKFRSMTDDPVLLRSPECPLELDRITPLGRFLRRSRIDELPQILNVLRGDMSLIGPRPDSYEHALHYITSVPGYRKRHIVRPGISGLAQTEIGYVVGSEATGRKVQADLYYVANTGLKMEAWLIWRTLTVILRRQGS